MTCLFTAILRHDTLGNVATLPSHYSIHGYNSHPAPPSVVSSAYPSRQAHHRRSTNSLPGRRSMKREGRARGSTRSTASAHRRKKRRDRSRGAPSDRDSIYQSQSQLVQNGHYDISSLDSFNPGGGNVNPLYSGSMASTGSRYSLYTINPNATIERICVDNNNRRRQRSPIYMNSNETSM